MGCDIHMFIEYKVGDAPWTADKNHQVIEEDGYEHVSQVTSSGRNYTLFGALAGVRSEGPDAKGFPEDVSDIIKKASDLYDSDGHSHSYSSLEEFKEALKECEITLDPAAEPIAFSDNYGYRWANLLNYLENQYTRLKLDIESEKMLLDQDINTEVQVRLVYYFDN